MDYVKIELVRFEIKFDQDETDLLGSYPLVVRAKGTNVASEIFVYHEMGTSDPYVNDLFEAVATPNQLEELPINQGNKLDLLNEAIPYYRRNQIELYCRNPDEAEQIWTELQDEVRALVKNLNAMTRLSGIKAVEITEGGIGASSECSNSELYSLFHDPSTSADLDENSDIVTPDSLVAGWLPISEIDNIALERKDPVPTNARLFYHLIKHPELLIEFIDLPTPTMLHQLQIDDVPYPQDSSGIYSITNDTIYWLDFDPEDFSDDINNLPQPPRNPWPEDYFVGAGSTNPRTLKLLVNCSA